MDKLNIIVVNYKTGDFIKKQISKLNQEKIDFEMIIADNSGELTREEINITDNIKILKNNLEIESANLSHVSGLNLCLTQLNFNNKYTIICDPDINSSDGAITKMIDYLERDDLDIIGIIKANHQKQVNKYPYVWFSIIKTSLLKSFYFNYLPIKKSAIIKIVRKICRILGILPITKDSGDSIFELIKEKNLKYKTIYPIKKENLIEKYSFLKNIPSIEYLIGEEQDSPIISHFNCGSSKRFKRIHKEENKDIFFRL